MSFETLLTDRAEVRRGESVRADGVIDEDAPGALVASDLPLRIARPSGRTAWRDDAGRLLVDYVGFLLVSAPELKVGDRVIVGGATYYVTGKPLTREGMDGPHHVEVPLRTEELG